ncbi:Galactose-1-phosphate uridylyltransferase (EC [Olavius sp. associated proteobacterium Delta 1]|nr:Galactose-1-phosphate uridylyltransferase (EC [Olavius sp. associated proteobacterium Delta 1]
MKFSSFDPPHRRHNPLTGEWVLVSPHRNRRPWQGQLEKPAPVNPPVYDPDCYLCPGNQRAGEVKNPNYAKTYVFTNDFSALLPETERFDTTHRLLKSGAARGTCKVVCFSPQHNMTLPEMSEAGIRAVVDTWAEQTSQLGHSYRWVQVFENKGAVMGCSNPHPHGQIWAVNVLPNEPAKEDRQQQTYFQEHKKPLLTDYARVEIERKERLVIQNAHWLAVVPYWAIWPFEILLLPRRHVLRIFDLNGAERDALADILKRLLTRYDNLFEVSFPYSMGWHGAPTDHNDYDYWQLHAHFYPPLLRSATVKKFMVGYEMSAEPQRDLTAEQAVQRLRGLSEIHYKSRH